MDPAGDKIGSVEQVFRSGDSGDPAFVTVRTGLFGMSESFVPLSGASLDESVIRVAFAKDRVKNGPRIDSDRGAITEVEEQELYRYYGLGTGEFSGGSALESIADDGVEAAEESGQAKTVTDEAGVEEPMEAAGPRPAGQTGPGHPPGGPPPPPPHLRKHVPVPPPDPGAHPVPHTGPHPGPHPGHRPPGPAPAPPQ
jgi:hypothetical protein